MKFTLALASFILSASAAAIDERALTCIIGNRQVDTVSPDQNTTPYPY